MLNRFKVAAALIVALPAFANAAPQVINATFSGTFSTEMRETTASGIIFSSVDIPFITDVFVAVDSAQYYNYPTANTTQTLYSGSPFATSLTKQLIGSSSALAEANFYYSNSVFWFGYNPVGTRNDFLSMASANTTDYQKNTQEVYQLVLRAGVGIPEAIEKGPTDASSLLAALTLAKDAGSRFSVTEFYSTQFIGSALRPESDWYFGSAVLTNVALIPEPGTAALSVLGIAALWTRSNRPRRARSVPRSSAN